VPKVLSVVGLRRATGNENKRHIVLMTDFFNLAPNFWTYFPLIKHRNLSIYISWLICRIKLLVISICYKFNLLRLSNYAGLGLYSNDNNYLTNRPFNHLTNSV